MQREKLKLIPGVPCTLVLDDAIGRPMNSRFHSGVEYLYNVEHRGGGYLLYLPVEGHQALRRIEAAAGDEIQILKTQTQGQAPQFQIRRVSDAELAVPTLQARPLSSQQEAPARGVHMLAPRSQVAAAAVHPLLEQMTRCLEVGYAANAAAFANLRKQGVEIDGPTWEDVRATGISFFIERQRNGAR